MINATSLIYFKSAIARIEGISPKDVVRFEVWVKVVFVIVRGRRPRFYSKKLFKQHFVTHRREQAYSVEISALPSLL